MGVSNADTVAHLRDIYDKDRLDYRTAPARAVARVWQHDGSVPKDEDIGNNATHQEEYLLRFRRTPSTQIIEASPGDVKTPPGEIIKAIFNPDDVINIQRTGREAGTLVKVSELPADLDGYKFLGPATFKKLEGVDVPQPDGSTKHMTRCNANVRARHMMVFEFDYKRDDPDGPAKLERFNTFCDTVAKFIPRILVLDTGGKSIHNCFDARLASPKDLEAVFNIGIQHGADKQMGVKSQVGRMPNVSSAGDGRDAQTVLYFDPKGDKYPPKGWDVLGLEESILKNEQLEYYYLRSNCYYMQSNTERWVAINRQSLTVHLAKQLIRSTKLEGEAVSPAEDMIASFESDKHIEAAMIGASGKHAGYYEENGSHVLVLKSPTFLKPRKGNWSTIRDFFLWMFREDPIEFEIFCAMHSDSIRNLRNDGRREARSAPCQALIIAGDAGAGKSFIVKYILPALYGGRWANANAYFDVKGSDFNSEMFASELLILDDAAILETSHKARHVMSEKTKEICVGSGEVYHGKFGDKVSIRPWWRLVRVMNTTPEALATLPLMDEGMADKWALLHAASMAGGPVDQSDPNWFEPWKDDIVSELPAFLHYLLREFKTPDKIKDPSGRYPVISYKNEKLIETIQEDSTESRLLHKMDNDAKEMVFPTDFEGGGATQPWTGTSSDLYNILTDDSGGISAQMRFTKMTPTPRVLTSQLQLLEKSHPHRVRYSARGLKPSKKNGVNYWRIMPACEITEEDCF
tara:strand:+ start:13762 stop:15999 length:2238 start_codon:yes stop_codon:yes gene_type:complete